MRATALNAIVDTIAFYPYSSPLSKALFFGSSCYAVDQIVICQSSQNRMEYLTFKKRLEEKKAHKAITWPA